jgi:hypothetical protein
MELGWNSACHLHPKEIKNFSFLTIANLLIQTLHRDIRLIYLPFQLTTFVSPSGGLI